ncbi:hypothetical protein [Flindersiella endophytica]
MTSGFLRRAVTALAAAALATSAMVAAGVGGAGVAYAEDPDPAFTIGDPDILESSGLAASSVHPGTYYTVNDSGSDARVYAVDSKGETSATLTMRNVEPYDWEAIASGPEGRIWVGDIGDNDRVRERVTLYRFKEPTDLSDQRLQWSRFRFRYTNGARDAETLLVHPKTGQVYVVSKTLGGGAIYAGPEDPSSDSVNSLEKVADAPSLITDGAFLPDGSAIVLRNYSTAYVMSWPDAKTIRTITLPKQQQGESLAVSNDGKNILVGSEGGNSPVYSLPVSGAAPPPAKSTPKPEATPSPSVSSETAVEKRDEGAGSSLFGGMSMWVLLSIAAIALIAGIAAFPRTGRGRRHHPPRERGGSGGGGPRERRPPPSPRREPAPAPSGSRDPERERESGGRDSASFGPGPYRPRRTPRPPSGRPSGPYGGGGPGGGGPGYSGDPRYPSDPRYPDDSRY